MECNKDEAIRAKDIAVKKFAERNFAGAKKFTLKAQTLYPGLEGISQMLTTLEVYISAENKINGEMDMYGILGVNPLADDETIKKHYRKQVLLLHPDKNKSIGADGAFQLVSEAFNFLSDKAKRVAYNSRRNIRTAHPKVPPKSGVPTSAAGFSHFYQKVPTQVGVSAAQPNSGRATDQKVPNQGGASGANRTVQQTFKPPGSSTSQQRVATPPPGVNGYHKHGNTTSSSGKPRKSSSKKPSGGTQGVFRSEDTFWTVCSRCKMQYEYVRIYLNQTLKCPTCQMGFLAVEVPPPSNLTPIGAHQHHKKFSSSSGHNSSGYYNSFGGAGARWSPFFGTTTYGSTTYSTSVPAQGTSVSQAVNERVKRGHEEVQATARWEWKNDYGSVFSGEDPSKKRREDDSFVSNSWGAIPSKAGAGNRESGVGYVPVMRQENPETGRTIFFGGISSKFNVNRELSLVELRKMLSEKALVNIHKKLKEWKEEKTKTREKQRQKSKVAKKIAMRDLEKLEASSDPQTGSQSAGQTEQEQEAVEMGLMSVPDPDFHVFDSDRSEKCFGENQVWATYDNDDGMPRFYGMIQEVTSLDPFEVKMSWLNSKSNSEFGPLDWIGRGFRKTCGEFRVGKQETNSFLNSFSHKVKWEKGSRGVQIYPQKGDIWALYKNWSPDWNKDTPNEIRHVYEMVEVLDDYSNEQGVSVAPLIKAAGFRTVFYKQPDPKQVTQIPREEVFRFSHQMPNYVLTGEEKPNASRDYVELDPAATPLELLKVITPSNQEQETEIGSKFKPLIIQE